ncbi:hypothetical protein FACS1894195_0080 [Bacteroidia bacterium]|nr:hypothetical protein FACS1894195_0080 [Bacteroidia bacterium]
MAANNKANLKKLYSALKSNNVFNLDTVSEDDFIAKMNEGNRPEQIYQAVTNAGHNLGEFKNFAEFIGYDGTPQQTTGTQLDPEMEAYLKAETDKLRNEGLSDFEKIKQQTGAPTIENGMDKFDRAKAERVSTLTKRKTELEEQIQKQQKLIDEYNGRPKSWLDNFRDFFSTEEYGNIEGNGKFDAPLKRDQEELDDINIELNKSVAEHLGKVERAERTKLDKISEDKRDDYWTYANYLNKLDENKVRASEDYGKNGLIQFANEFGRNSGKMGEELLTFGGKELYDANKLDNLTDSINEKISNGEELTETEQAFSNSLAIHGAVEENIDKQFWQRIAETTTASLPFMASFIGGGAVLKTIGKGAKLAATARLATAAKTGDLVRVAQIAKEAGVDATKLANYTAKATANAGKHGKAVQSIASNTLDVGIAGVEAAARTAIDPRTYATIIELQTGNPDYDFNPETGELKYNGQKDQMDFDDAVWEGALNAYIENLSELSGGAITKIGGKLTPKKYDAWYKRHFGQIEKWAKKAGINGGATAPVVEKLEEDVGSGMRIAAGTKDAEQEKKNMSDPMHHLEVFVSMLPTTGSMNILGAVSAGVQNRRNSKFRHNVLDYLARSENRMDAAFNHSEDIDENNLAEQNKRQIRDVIDKFGDQAQSILEMGFGGQEFTPQQQQAVAEYATLYATQRGIDAANEEGEIGKITAIRKKVGKLLNADMGGIVTANVTDEGDVYVTEGELYFNEDGTINEKNSTQLLVITRPDGTTKEISLSEIVNVVDVETPDEIIEKTAEQIEAEKKDAEENARSQQHDLDDKVKFTDENGKVVLGKIVEKTQDGHFTVQDVEGKIYEDVQEKDFDQTAYNMPEEVLTAQIELEQAVIDTEGVDAGEKETAEIKLAIAQKALSQKIKERETKAERDRLIRESDRKRENNSPTGSQAQAVGTAAQEEAKKQRIEEIKNSAPKQAGGEIDYNKLRDTAPQDYIELFDYENGEGKARAKFDKLLSNAHSDLQKAQERLKKLEEGTDDNATVKQRKVIEAKKAEVQKYDEIIHENFGKKEIKTAVSEDEYYDELVNNRPEIPFETLIWDKNSGTSTRSNGKSNIIDLAGRKIVVIQINGRNIPFYLSTGNGEKVDVESGKWYPFFGIASDGWLNKLSANEINNYYGIEELRKLAESLNRNIGDIRGSNTIPKGTISGDHITFINKNLSPTENETTETKNKILKNIAETKVFFEKLREEKRRQNKISFAEAIDRIFDGNKDGLQQHFFEVATTPEFMKKLGITGDKFTLSYGTISRHINKDDQHTLTPEIWKKLPEAIQTPFAITSYKDGKTDGYRIYTTIQTAKGYVVVGVDVKKVDKNVEVNSISTVFGKEGNRTEKEAEVLYESKTITPQQRLLLAKPNSMPYPDGEGLSADKSNTNPENKQRIEQIISSAPKQKNGNVDYDALFKQSPNDFIELWEFETGANSARPLLSKRQAKLNERINNTKANLKKAEDAGSFNRVAELENNLANLKAEKEALDKLIYDKYGRKEREKYDEEIIGELSEPTLSDTETDTSKPQTTNQNGGTLINAESPNVSADKGTANNSENQTKFSVVKDYLTTAQQKELEKANNIFNEELDKLKNGNHKGVLHLGKPLGVLQSSGIKNGEITISENTLKNKLKQHGLTTDDLQNLAQAIQQPIMVYEWGTKAKSTVIVTELTTKDGRKITVALRAENKNGNLEVNEVSSIHGKVAERFLSEMGNAKEGGLANALRYVEKEKALNWLGYGLSTTLSQTDGHNSVTKVIQDFVNPKLSEEKSHVSSKKLTPISKTAFTKLIGWLKKTGLAKDVILDENEMRRVLGEKGIKTFQAVAELSSVNAAWNKALDDFKAGKLKPHEILNFGKPLEILRAAGIKSGNIGITSDVLEKHLNKHGLTTEDIKNLAEAIQQPIMVYEWGTRSKSTVIVTELTTKDGRKITVALRAENKNGNLEVNEVASIHGKAAERFLSEMENAKEGGLSEALRYVEKEKALNWFGLSTPIPNQGLKSAAKVIQDFENPKIEEDFLRMFSVWHGTGANFDRFNKSKFTTGEGVMAYGAGHYFTDKKEIAKGYGNARSYVPELVSDEKIADFLLDAVKTTETDEEYIAKLERESKEVVSMLKNSDTWKVQDSMRYFLPEIQDAFNKHIKIGGNLLKVKIHGNKTVDELNFIRWDKELSQKNYEKIFSQIEKEGLYDKILLKLKEPFFNETYNSLTELREKDDFENFYKELSRILGAEETSMLLLRSGIDGIQYPTEYQSKGEHEDSFNYVVFDDNAIEIEEKMRLMATSTGEVYGFVTQYGTVYIDPNKLNANTPIHEFGHLWNSYIKENNKQLWERGKELIKATQYYKGLASNPAYSKLTEDQKVDEALAQMIGDRGEQIVSAKYKSAIGKLKEWLKEVWDFIAQHSGIREKSTSEIQNMTLDDFVNGAVADLLSGKEIRNNRDSDGQKQAQDLENFLNNTTEGKNLVAQAIDENEQNQQIRSEFPRSQIFAENPSIKNKKRKILRTDEYGKKIVWENNDYFIAFSHGDRKNYYVSLWDKSTGKLVGRIYATLENFNVPKGFLSIDKVEIDKKHRGKGLAKEMYQAVIDFSDDNVKGISSYLPNRINKKQVPKIWEKLGGIKEGDYQNARFQISITPEGKAKVTYVPSSKNGGQEVSANQVDYDFDVKGLTEANAQEMQRIKSEAQANGTFMKAPNGKKSNLNERQWLQVRTDNFKEWFGDWLNDAANASKVVDENGEPLKVYHGTMADEFNTFEIDENKYRRTSAKGFFFTSDKESATKYAGHKLGEVKEVFLNITNPEIINYRKKKEYNYRGFSGNPGRATEFLQTRKELFNEFKSKNGLIALNVADNMSYSDNSITDVYVAFNPSQIKSATDNNGNFDDASDDIRYQFIGEQGAENLDKAEEATTRLDNLAVAREMESKHDEKAARIEKLRNSKPIEITGKEITPSEDLKRYRKNAIEYGKELRGEYTNKDTGETVLLARRGIDEVLHHDGSNIAHIQSVAAIPQIIQNGIFIDTVENEDTEKNRDVKSYNYYVVGLKINGIDYTVKSAIAVDMDGNRYYDHALTKIEKGKLLDETARITSAPPHQGVVLDHKDKRLISILQIPDKKTLAKKIKLATGWERGADGKWRYETDDRKISINKDKFNELRKTSGMENYDTIKLPELIGKNNEIFTAYPQLKNIDVSVQNIKGLGMYSIGGNGQITISDKLTNLSANSVLIHEIQHIIQHLEKFAIGGNETQFRNSDNNSAREDFSDFKKLIGHSEKDNTTIQDIKDYYLENRDSEHHKKIIDRLDRYARSAGFKNTFLFLDQTQKYLDEPYLKYRRLAGETEARNASDRRNMSPEERRASLAEETEDVSREDQIFINDALQNSNNNSNFANQNYNNDEQKKQTKLAGSNGVYSREQEIADRLENGIRTSENELQRPLSQYEREDLEKRIAFDYAKQQADNVSAFIKDVLDGKINSTQEFFEIPEQATKLAEKKLGHPIKSHKVRVEEIKHIDNRHGINGTETKKDPNKIGLRKEDIALMPYIMGAPDSVEKGTSKKGKESVVYTKYLSNGKVLVVEHEVSAGSTDMENISMWAETKNHSTNVPSAKLKAASGLRTETHISQNDKNRPINDGRRTAINAAPNTHTVYNSHINQNDVAKIRKDFETAIEKEQKNATDTTGELRMMSVQEDNTDSKAQIIRDNVDAGVGLNGFKKLRTQAFAAYADKFIAVKKYLDTLREHGVEIQDHNDYYLQITSLSGRIEARMKDFDRNYREPMMQAVHSLKDKGIDYHTAEDYVMLKHGLERNEYLNKERKTEGKDYSGMDAIMESINDTRAKNGEAKISAEQYIAQIEQQAGKDLIDNLWKKINEATTYSIDKAFATGLSSKEKIDELKARWKYYVPLRGHDDTTAEDIYDYEPFSGTRSVNIFKKIGKEGRKSRAETPFSYIVQSAYTTITSGQNNVMNQTWYRLAQRDKTGSMTISKTWFEKVGEDENGNNIFEQKEPVYSDDFEQYMKNMAEFNKRMSELESQGLATQRKGKLNLGSLFITKPQAQQHGISVWENGQHYTVYLNVNPIVAQEVNDEGREIIAMLKWLRWTSRTMSANFTSRNPVFIATNALRDFEYASTTLAVREGAAYTGKFLKNYTSLRNHQALRRALSGELDLSNPLDRMARDFLMYGGKTGYSRLEELKKTQKKVLREATIATNATSHKIEKTGKAILHGIEYINDLVENKTRFAVYVTSIEMGRSKIRAVSDAKEVSINFNRKGNGRMGAAEIKALYLFINPAVQALSLFGGTIKRHPGGMAILLGSFTALGFFSAFLADDDDDYWKMSDSERDNNFIIPTPWGKIKIPISQELRPFNKIGVNLAMYVRGKKDAETAAYDAIMGLIDLLPINPTNSVNSGWAQLLPDAVRWTAELYSNKDYRGMPIKNKYKDADKTIPGYLSVRTDKAGKVYAPEFIVEFTRLLDIASGGDGVKPGLVSLNPDEVNHVLNSYFGGLYNSIMNGVIHGIQAGVSKDIDFDSTKTPLRTFYSPTESLKNRNTSVNNDYYSIVNEIADSKKYINRYREQYQEGKITDEEYNAKISKFNKYVDVIGGYIQLVKEIEKQMKGASEEKLKELRAQADEFKEKAIKSYYDGKE